jgi:hypothetical protein
MRLNIQLATCAVTMVLATATAMAGPYDGTYVGTSLALSGTTTGGKGNVCTTTATAPAPLTIANGHAQTHWGTGTLQGDVGPDGKLIMHSELAGRFEGQIDASGALKGYYQGVCVFNLAWQRRG